MRMLALALLRQGGHVVLVRHTVTTPGRGHARRIGEAFRLFRVPVEAIYSSPWCRCVETAGLAFGAGAQIWDALSNLFGRPENRQKQVDELSARIGAYDGKGNLVLVMHGSTVLALTRISPQTGEMVILAPKGEGRFAVVSRLAVP